MYVFVVFHMDFFSMYLNNFCDVNLILVFPINGENVILLKNCELLHSTLQALVEAYLIQAVYDHC